MKPTTFQGREAWLYSQMGKHDYAYRLLFPRGGTWYEISLRLPIEEDIPNSDWWPYLMSFKAQDAPPAPATSQMTNDQTRMTNQ